MGHITREEQISVFTENAKILLDNVNEGLLLFNHDFIIEEGYSTECLDIFNQPTLSSIDIRDILFEKDATRDREIFEMAISNILNTPDYNEKKLYESFLPSDMIVNDKTITLEYRTINNIFMLIASDITEKLLLEEEIEKQHKIRDMIVSVASSQEEFLELKEDFIKFLESLDISRSIESCDETLFISRTLHTYKGIFSQNEMVHITEAIHNTELNIKENGIECINPSFLQAEFTKDMTILSKVLGEDYEQSLDDFDDIFGFGDIPEVTYSIGQGKIDELQYTLNKYIENNQHDPDTLNNLLLQVKSFKDVLLHELLSDLKEQVKKTSFKLKKDVNPLVIEESNIYVPPSFKPLITTLVHIINNSIDHGIESIEKRMELNKNPFATITCNHKQVDNNIIIELSDDGSGIDINKLEKKILEKNICTADKLSLLSDEEKCNFIFCDYVSVKDEATKISGMGIGMSAVKAELDKLNGEINIENKQNVGVKFTLTIPLERNL